MIEIDATHVTAYLEPVMFRWSPCLVDLWREDEATTSVVVRIIDQTLGKNVVYNIDFFDDVYYYSLDISGALQTMGEDVKIVVQTSGHTGFKDIYNINGANRIRSPFGGEYHVRIWPGYDMTLPIFFQNQTTVYLGRRGTPVTVVSLPANTASGLKLDNFTPTQVGRYFANGYIRNGAAWDAGQWAFEVVSDCAPKNPIFLRWVDNSGLTWYWLFDCVENTVSASDNIVYGRLASWVDDYVNEWQEEKSKTVSTSAKIIAYKVTAEEYKVVKTLATASIVDAFDEDAGLWYRVRIADGEYTEPKGNYKDVEYTIELAPTQTQLP